MRRAVLVCACALAVVLLTGCGTAVPDVKGKTVEQSKKVLTAAGFTVGQVKYDEGAVGATGAVVSQDPAAGTRKNAGDPVGLTVAGPAPVPAPTVVGLDRAKASVALAAAGLQLGAVAGAYDSTVPSGTVVSQEPSAGVETPKGSSVALVLSTGPQPVAVPGVVGKAAADAVAVLKGAGFLVKQVNQAGKAKKGTVAAQSPAGGAMAQPGTTVAITVSTGVVMVKVPNIHGMMNPDALLKSLGLVPVGIAIHGPIEPDAAGIGEAYRQKPAAGTMVPKGSKVTYHFWWEAG
jgi:beta-lactam-binding protein with PASTA domain